jgi:hypothetical protein
MNKPKIVHVASLLLVAAVAACPAGPGSGTGGEGEGEDIGRDDCPETDEGISVCAVQSSGANDHPRLDDAVVLAEVAATSPKFVFDTDNETGEPSIYAVFVSDVPTAPFGGVLVTFFADVAAPAIIAIGDVLRVEGTYTEDSVSSPDTETRVRATAITALGRTETVTPLEADAADFTSDDGEQYEGTLVEFRNVKVSALEQFFFTLDNGVNVSGKIFRYTALVDEEFAAIRGVVQYDVFAGGYLLTPRNASDLESTFRPELETVSVTALNDGTIMRCAFNDFANCKTNVAGVVVSPPKFINTDDNGPRFGFYVADPDNVDAGGRLQAQSGVFVTITPQHLTFPPTLEGYTFEQDDDRNFLPGAAPDIGDLVIISGQNSSNFDNSEFRFVSYLKNNGVAVPPLPALFDGELPAADPRHPSRLSGGRPASDGNFGVADGFDPPLEGTTAAAGLEDWEGVLVEIINAEVTTACYASPFMNSPRDFGYFLVTGNVEIGNLFFLSQPFGGLWGDVAVAQQTCANVANKCGDSRTEGDVIGVTGIINYSFNVHRVNPRIIEDLDAPLADFSDCN